MHSALAFATLLPILAALDLAFRLVDPERRLVRSVLVSGFVVGRVAAGVAW